MLGTFIDITKEVENRELLTEKQKLTNSFETSVNQAPMAMAILKGPDFVIELGNAKIFEAWGKPASVTGMKLADALPEIRSQGFLDLLADVYKTGVPYFGYGTAASRLRNSHLLSPGVCQFVTGSWSLQGQKHSV